MPSIFGGMPVGLGISIWTPMEQWTEPTSLRLLELIASTAMAAPACSDVDSSGGSADTDIAAGNAAGSSQEAVVRALVKLALSDAHFSDWLRARIRSRDATASGSERSPTQLPPSLPSATEPISTQPISSPPRPLPAVHTAESDRAAFEGHGHSSAAEEWFTCEFKRRLVVENWLAWLAAESLVDAPPPRGSTAGDDDRRDHAATDATDATDGVCEPSFRRVLVASAQAALRSRGLAAELERTRRELARELAYDMAYGLSHELNNPLANIAARARLLAEDESSEHKRQLLAAIVDQAMRGCEMIADLMLVARPPVSKLEPVDVVAVARETVAKARPWAEARGLNLAVVTHDHALIVSSDRAALVEALWTLLRNAIEVARHQITLTVSLAPSAPSSLLPGGTSSVVSLSVQDDGPGLSPHAQAHAFHPYFSGREAGRGLGVGLAKADRIASLSGGSSTIANAAGGGCVAIISLPLLSK